MITDEDVEKMEDPEMRDVWRKINAKTRHEGETWEPGHNVEVFPIESVMVDVKGGIILEIDRAEGDTIWTKPTARWKEAGWERFTLHNTISPRGHEQDNYSPALPCIRAIDSGTPERVAARDHYNLCKKLGGLEWTEIPREIVAEVERLVSEGGAS